jgi:hypothetical protein
MKAMADQPLTRADLLEVLAVFKKELVDTIEGRLEATKKELGGQIQASLGGQIQALRDELIEVARDNQTELLNAFIPYQEGANLRMHVLEQKDASVTARMAILERRLQQIEKKLLLEPPAA